MAHPRINNKRCSCSECLAEKRAYGAARRAAGLNIKSQDLRECNRCGVMFDGFYRFIPSAPCRDCREFLTRDDGDTTQWLKPRGAQLLSVAA